MAYALLRPLSLDTCSRLKTVIRSAVTESGAGACAVVMDAASRDALEACCVAVGEDLKGDVLEGAGAAVIAALDASDLEWTQTGPVIFITRAFLASAPY